MNLGTRFMIFLSVQKKTQLTLCQSFRVIYENDTSFSFDNWKQKFPRCWHLILVFFNYYYWCYITSNTSTMSLFRVPRTSSDSVVDDQIPIYLSWSYHNHALEILSRPYKPGDEWMFHQALLIQTRSWINLTVISLTTVFAFYYGTYCYFYLLIRCIMWVACVLLIFCWRPITFFSISYYSTLTVIILLIRCIMWVVCFIDN